MLHVLLDELNIPESRWQPAPHPASAAAKAFAFHPGISRATAVKLDALYEISVRVGYA
jgi:hypothetical protein